MVEEWRRAATSTLNFMYLRDRQAPSATHASDTLAVMGSDWAGAVAACLRECKVEEDEGKGHVSQPSREQRDPRPTLSQGEEDHKHHEA